MQERADGETPKLRGRKAELLPDLNGTQRNAARVLLRVLVLAGERDHQRPHLRSEERFLGRDEVRSAQVSDERPRGNRPQEIRGNRDADECDSHDLEAVPEPPPEVHEAQEQCGDECGREPDQADDDDEVGHPVREEVGTECSDGEQSVERETDDQDGPGQRTAVLRDARDEVRLDDGSDAEAGDDDDGDSEESQSRLDGLRPPEHRQHAQRENRATDRERRAAGEGDDPVHLHEDAGGRQPVQHEQRGHDAEGAPDEDGASVTSASSDDGQGDRRDRGDECSQRDTPEVDAASEVHRLASDEVEKRRRNAGQKSRSCEHRDEPISHASRIGSTQNGA